MNVQVSFQSTSVAERFGALCTFMRPLSTVNEQVSFKDTSLSERFVALCTFVRLFSTVGYQVHLHIACLRKQLFTQDASMFAVHV